MARTIPSNPDSVLPLFARVAFSLRQDIVEGRLPPGAKLPSEAELEGMFGVSRITVRQALAQLDASHLIEKINGKGSFVTQRADAPRLGMLAGFFDLMRLRGKAASGRTLSVRTQKATAAVARALHVQPGTRVTAIAIVRCINDEPIAVGKVWAQHALAQALLAQDLDNHDVMSVLEGALGYRLESTQIEASAVKAGKGRGELLQVPPDAPLLHMRFTPHDIAGHPLTYSEMFFRPDRFTYRSVVRR